MSGLDGLRAVAVIGVLIYHAGARWLPGGFLGVDLFFVISGFLITWLLVVERQREGAISIGQFYLRRARRLLPALITVVAATTAYMAVFFRGDLVQARGDIAAAAGYFSNWWYVLHHRSYFVAAGRQPPFQHLWSLAVEEQFYLVWPLLVGLLLLTRVRLRWVFTVALAGGVGSALWMRTLAIRGDVPYDTDSSRVYFGTDTHASALLLGAAGAAIMLGLARRRNRARRDISPVTTLLADLAGLASLAAVVWAMHSWSEVSPGLFRGGFFEFAAVAVVLVASFSLPGSMAGALLDLQPLRWVGTRSYGLYLWHWPIFVYTRPGLDWQLHGWQALAVRLALTAGLTELTFQFIERPIRERGFTGVVRGRSKVRRSLAWEPSRRKLVVPVLGGVCGILAVVGTTTLVTHYRPASHGRVDAGVQADPLPTLRPPVSPSPRNPSPVGPVSASVAVPASHVSTPPASVVDAKPPVSTGSHPPPTPKGAPPPAGKSTSTPPPIPAGPPPNTTAVGDSVLLDGKIALQDICPSTEVYALVGWQTKSVFEEIDTLRAAGHLGQVVVIATGTNGLVKEKDLETVLNSLADRARVVIVNDHMDRAWEPPNNAMFPKVVAKYPNAVLLDWDTAANKHPEWLGGDGVHLTPQGRAPYAALIKAAAGC